MSILKNRVNFAIKVYNYIQANSGSSANESYLKESYEQLVNSAYKNEPWYIDERLFTFFNISSYIVVYCF